MKRRNFIKTSAAGTALLSSSGLFAFSNQENTRISQNYNNQSDMKKLIIKRINETDPNSNVKVEAQLESQTSQNVIDVLNWDTHTYLPDVRFRIGHQDDCILLKFNVEEKCILAKETSVNGDVYKDSCVEFFISFDNKNYYNLECSCIGTIHLAYGTGRNGRNFVNPELINEIKINSSLGDKPFDEKIGNFKWEMMIQIPVKCFAFDKIDSLKGLKATANLYKCGDGMSTPHYVTWNKIKTEFPDYHRPEFFGEIEFE